LQWLDRNLPTQLKLVSQETLARHIAPRLLDITFFMEPAVLDLYGALFKPKERQGLLAEPFYSQLVPPFILQMYQKPTKQVRLGLLDLVDAYVPSISVEDIQSGIMPHLTKGMEEADDEIWVKTFCAITSLYAVVLEAEFKKKQAAAKAGTLSTAEKEDQSEVVLDTILLPYYCDIIRSSTPMTLKSLATRALLRLWALGYDKGVRLLFFFFLFGNAFNSPFNPTERVHDLEGSPVYCTRGDASSQGS